MQFSFATLAVSFIIFPMQFEIFVGEWFGGCKLGLFLPRKIDFSMRNYEHWGYSNSRKCQSYRWQRAKFPDCDWLHLLEKHFSNQWSRSIEQNPYEPLDFLYLVVMAFAEGWLAFFAGSAVGSVGLGLNVRVYELGSSLFTNLRNGWKMYTPLMNPTTTPTAIFVDESPPRRFLNISQMDQKNNRFVPPNNNVTFVFCLTRKMDCNKMKIILVFIEDIILANEYSRFACTAGHNILHKLRAVIDAVAIEISIKGAPSQQNTVNYRSRHR